MPECTITKDEFAALGAEGVAQKLKDAGFVFEHEGCPWCLRAPYSFENYPSGDAVTYRQWQEERRA